MFDLCNLIDARISESDKHSDKEHRQHEDEIIDDQVDISSEIEVLTLST